MSTTKRSARRVRDDEARAKTAAIAALTALADEVAASVRGLEASDHDAVDVESLSDAARFAVRASEAHASEYAVVAEIDKQLDDARAVTRSHPGADKDST